jgi:hypothetical protein
MTITRRRCAVAVLCTSALLALSGCSEGADIRGGASPSVKPSASSSSPSTPTPSPAPTEIDEGVLEPTNAPSPAALDPSIPRADEAPEAVRFAQAFAAALLYVDTLYVPGAEKLGATVMQAPPGLSITRLVDWYEYVKSDAAYVRNQQMVDGYLFVPPERAERRYAVPAAHQLVYSAPTITAGPRSTIDSRPTLEVAFTVQGKLVWIDRSGQAWTAPVTRDIAYTMASENDGWVVDRWRNTPAKIGTATRMPKAEAATYAFTAWDARDISGFPPVAP